MKSKSAIIIFILISVILSLHSVDDEPSWIHLKKAENLKEKGEYSLAIIEARKARMIFINEKINEYYESIYNLYRDKIEYELTVMKDKKREELLKNDGYPQYHELMGDLYVLSDFFDEAEKEYKMALSQKVFFEYSQKEMEINYKVASIYQKRGNYELEDIVYREITNAYFESKNKEYWNRIKTNIYGNEKIKGDITLNHVFKIYRIDGIEYLNALYKIGRRSALLQKDKEALFYLANAAIVWMTYTSNQIKKYYFEFQYSNPIDFINYITKDRLYEYNTEDSVMDEIFFFIGYVYFREKDEELSNHYFDLAMMYSKITKREEELKKRIEYLKLDSNYQITLDELTK